MKLIFLIIALLIASLKANTQNFLSMINDSIFWDVNYAEMGYICGGFGGGGTRFCFGNDTVINNLNYTNFRAFGMQSIYYPVDCPPFLVDTIAYNTQYYLREDSLGKIFLYNDENQVESLIFDYNLQIGDSLILGSGNIFYIDSIVYNGVVGIAPREFIDNTSIPHGYFTEGIGGPAGPIYEPFYIFESGPQLTCIGSLNNNGNCYDFVSNSPHLQLNNESVYLYPTVASDNIYISDISNIIGFRIINLYGTELVKSNKVESTQINIENLKSGIYFIELKFNNNVFITKKIIKI